MTSENFDYRDRSENATASFIGVGKDLDVAYDDNVINLSIGVSSPELLGKCSPLILQATQHCLVGFQNIFFICKFKILNKS